MVDERPLRFRVDSVFTITGRGTAVVGIIESGRILQSGQNVSRVRDGHSIPIGRAVYAPVRAAARRPDDPTPVGFILPDLTDPSEIEVGDIIVTE